MFRGWNGANGVTQPYKLVRCTSSALTGIMLMRANCAIVVEQGKQEQAMDSLNTLRLTGNRLNSIYLHQRPVLIPLSHQILSYPQQ